MIDFLVIEDNNPKFEQIDSLLKSKVKSVFVKRVKSVDLGIEQLKTRQYGFVIVDLNLPLMEGGKAVTNGGINLLKWIKKNQKKGKCKVPSNIIGLTEFPDLIEKFSSELNLCRVFAYEYKLNDEDWKNQLIECIEEYSLKLDQEMVKVATKKIIYSVHGIETNGEWQKELSKNLNLDSDEYIHISHEYNFFPVLSFLIPPLRWLEVRRFKKELEFMAEKHPGCCISLIGHSFGTYLIAKSLNNISQSSTPYFDRIILCGSVLKASYDWDEIIRRHNIKSILNDCALNDGPLVMSQAVAVGLGMAGRVGFKRKHGQLIENRFFTGGHSDFFNPQVFGHWERFIKKGDVVKVNEKQPVTIIDSLCEAIILYSPWIILIILSLSIYYYF
ncbi:MULTISPECIES: hypothetical protein [unclassified Colwellia]|uniref:hypothetical protein n=1 Tax=unclassified Colwellia TaxID=196834 RepID=UPI0015F38B1A|nr:MULTISPECIES: hypothetical protein [unclassified Colwellia]MBA6254740.1 hypothetical protein [Colwellia sp. MB3u-28]MBA6259250.1 hypothetical protein [Colwellia sp. MB3u-41]